MVSGSNRKASFAQIIKSNNISLENNYKTNNFNNQNAFKYVILSRLIELSVMILDFFFGLLVHN